MCSTPRVRLAIPSPPASEAPPQEVRSHPCARSNAFPPPPTPCLWGGGDSSNTGTGSVYAAFASASAFANCRSTTYDTTIPALHSGTASERTPAWCLFTYPQPNYLSYTFMLLTPLLSSCSMSSNPAETATLKNEHAHTHTHTNTNTHIQCRCPIDVIQPLPPSICTYSCTTTQKLGVSPILGVTEAASTPQ